MSEDEEEIYEILEDVPREVFGGYENEEANFSSVFTKSSSDKYKFLINIQEVFEAPSNKRKADGTVENVMIKKYRWSCKQSDCPPGKLFTGFGSSTQSIRSHYNTKHPEINVDTHHIEVKSNDSLQNRFYKALFKLIIDNNIPFIVVTRDSFKEPFQLANKNLKMITRTRLNRMIESEYEMMVVGSIENFKNINSITCTCDIWSSHHRSFLGITGKFQHKLNHILFHRKLFILSLQLIGLILKHSSVRIKRWLAFVSKDLTQEFVLLKFSVQF